MIFRRKVRYVRGSAIEPARVPNERWSVDFVHDRLTSGRTIRAMNVVDDCTRECLALDVRYSFGSAEVIGAFEALCDLRGKPATLRFDNGSEVTSRAMLQ